MNSVDSDLVDLIGHKFVKRELSKNGARATRQFTTLEPLQVAFVGGSGEAAELVGTHLFGYDNAVGVAVVKDIDGFSAARQEIIANERLLRTVEGAQVSLMFRGDPKKWSEFYDQVEKEGWFDKIGPRIGGYSGLRHVGSAEIKNIETALQNVLLGPEDRRRLKEKFGVVASMTAGKQYGLDVALVNERSGKIHLANLKHVRKLGMRGKIVEATVEDSAEVPGFVVPHYGENELQTMDRAAKVERALARVFPEIEDIPVFDMRQAKLAKKLSLTKELEPRASGTNVDLEELYRLLFLGESYLSSGILAGYSLPGNAAEMLGLTSEAAKDFYGYDIVFFQKDRSGRHRISPLERPIWGLDLRNNSSPFRPINDVAAMVMVPSGMKNDAMLELAAKKVGIMKRHVVSSQPASVIPVTSELVDFWRGTEFFVKSPESPIEIFPGGKNPQLRKDQILLPQFRSPLSRQESPESYFVRWPDLDRGPRVGGGRTAWFSLDSDGNQTGIMINMGNEFNRGTPEQNGIGGGSPTNTGLTNALERGDLPMIPGSIALTELYRTAKYIGHQKDNPVAKFVRAELALRGNPVLFDLILASDRDKTDRAIQRRKELARFIFEQGKIDAKSLYGGRRFDLEAVIINHAHADHFPWHRVWGNASSNEELWDKEIIGKFSVGDEQYIMAPLTHAFLALRGAKGGSWKDELLYHVHSEAPRVGNNPYPRDPRRVTFFPSNGGIVQLPSGVRVEGRLTTHSIPHSVATLITGNDGRSLLSTGDFRSGELTDKMIQGFAGRAHTIEIEITNGPGSNKPRKTEAHLRETFSKIMKTHAGLVVFAVPDNNPDRLKIIYEEAKDSKRDIVVVDPKHAASLEFLRFEIAQASPDNDMFVGFKDYPLLFQDLYLWDKDADNPKSYVKFLNDAARNSERNVKTVELADQSRRTVLVVSPYDQISSALNQLEVPPDSAFVHASFRPYSTIEARNIFGRFENLKRMGFSVYSQFTVSGSENDAWVNEGEISALNFDRLRIRPENFATHISGHGFYEDVNKTLFSLLNGKYRGRTVLLTHGEKPVVYKRSLQQDALKRQADRMEKELKLAEGDIRKRLGLSRPEDLEIVASMKHYDPRAPFVSPGKQGLIFNTFTHRI